jgi:hypothetical protein
VAREKERPVAREKEIIIQFDSLLFMCWQNSHKTNYGEAKEHKHNKF